MLSNLVLNKLNQEQIKSLTTSIPHGLILTGKPGVGLLTIAKELATANTKQPEDIKVITPDEKGLIAISTIKQLYATTRSKLTTNKVVIIDDADAMSIDAQNAFLKLLEEPVHRIHFLLTSHRPGQLLPTVSSRLQHIEIKPISKEQTKDMISACNNLSVTESAQTAFIAEGLPAEIKRINEDAGYKNNVFELAATAKALLTANSYQKMLISDGLSSDRLKTLKTVEIMARMMRMQLKSRQDDQLLDYLNTMTDVYEQLQRNAHVRTQLLRLCV